METCNTMILESYFKILYARAALDISSQVIREQCYGCQNDCCSQTDHTCLMLSEHEQLEIYFDLILEKINFNELLSTWDNAVKELNLSLDVYTNVKEKYFSNEWKQHVNTDKYIQTLLQTVMRMQSIDSRLLASEEEMETL